MKVQKHIYGKDKFVAVAELGVYNAFLITSFVL
jgi:hypothetical protein